MSEFAARLAATDDPALAALGFHDEDRADVLVAIRAALAEPGRLADVEALAGRIRAGIGRFEERGATFEHPAAASDWRGVGVLPMLALIATAEDVRAFHRGRGIPDDISRDTLADLGRQAWVHRRTYGALGLHTYGWMTTSYSGDLYALGRLQFNLDRRDDGWTLSTHIPESGPLEPDAVHDSLGRALPFFAEHFPDHPVHEIRCHSWLLDPQLADSLRPDSNTVRFQRLWTIEGDPLPGDDDALFFVFRRRGEVDRASLPRETSLQRAILDRLDAGGHWYVREGTLTR